ncbi:flagellar basal body-associated FliL family protein [Nocardioides mangrovi]|uniref:Flagellar protein FliL n=1 Tax=Nocardioides mangrovi TaxID=2874580 RepID=A0ABS7UAH8_9ACTN|nr:flagellar basal body-associated FliL family protein [Nocardioides mangrovi]MBZ5737822.1 flagellar basal body-associated FliL family protein [Nocardioides mangrovi]
MTATAEKAPDKEAEGEGKKKGGKKKLIIIVVAVLAIAGAGYWFFLKPSGPEPPPEPGAILTLDSTQINLSGEHYLRLGLALQLTTTAGEEVDGSKALDAAIELFSGRTLEQVEGHSREKLKDKLEKELEELYEGEVMGVYFTEFVTQ